MTGARRGKRQPKSWSGSRSANGESGRRRSAWRANVARSAIASAVNGSDASANVARNNVDDGKRKRGRGKKLLVI